MPSSFEMTKLRFLCLLLILFSLIAGGNLAFGSGLSLEPDPVRQKRAQEKDLAFENTPDWIHLSQYLGSLVRVKQEKRDKDIFKVTSNEQLNWLVSLWAKTTPKNLTEKQPELFFYNDLLVHPKRVQAFTLLYGFCTYWIQQAYKKAIKEEEYINPADQDKHFKAFKARVTHFFHFFWPSFLSFCRQQAKLYDPKLLALLPREEDVHAQEYIVFIQQRHYPFSLTSQLLSRTVPFHTSGLAWSSRWVMTWYVGGILTFISFAGAIYFYLSYQHPFRYDPFPAPIRMLIHPF